MSVGQRQAGVDEQAVAVLHQSMPHEAQLRLLALSLTVEPGIPIGGRGMRIVRPLLAMEVGFCVAPAACRRFARVRAMKATCNPGGPGHHWVKSWAIDCGPYRTTVDPETGLSRVYVPARVGDNPKLLENDPRYIDRLRSVGSTELVRAWLDGDWTIVQGAFFTGWDPKRHVIRPFVIPMAGLSSVASTRLSCTLLSWLVGRHAG